MTKRENGWIYTYSGLKFNAFEPHNDQICIEDIAHALALNCRFNGHIHTHFSVAQHSIIISKLVPKEYALEALLHDAPEAYLTDVPRPIKRFLPECQEIEDNILEVILKKFGCVFPLPDCVLEIDHHMVADEAIALWPKRPEWVNDFTPNGIEINPWNWKVSEKLFLERFRELKR